jgi:hypothetical protein
MKVMARKEVLIKDETYEQRLLRTTLIAHPLEKPHTDFAGRPDVTPGVFRAIVIDKGEKASEPSPQSIRDVLEQSRGRR